jgi:hypothetical protein
MTTFADLLAPLTGNGWPLADLHPDPDDLAAAARDAAAASAGPGAPPGSPPPSRSPAPTGHQTPPGTWPTPWFTTATSGP